MSDKSTLVIVSQPPSPEPEALELAMALAAFDQQVGLLFTGAGLLWLVNDLQARQTGGKSPARLIKALPMYDCENIYACQQSLDQLGLAATSLSALARLIDSSAISQLIQQHDHCLRF
ncbi:DsrE family protein [Oceanobacter mangrovi]|uniref:DsrE family protein n=1 Tax=Oceanobacter mangrovi TaxID=2862510 RepID=UPI001C8E1CB7|nr:DsrE family protein [Oceanobacter mangrovi]